MKLRRGLAAVLCLCLLLGACGLAQSESTGESGTLSSSDNGLSSSTGGSLSGTLGTLLTSLTTAAGEDVTVSTDSTAPDSTATSSSTGSATEGPTGSTAPDATEPDTETDISGEPLPDTGDAVYWQLFDKANKVQLSLDMDTAEIAKMQADYEANSKSPIYRRADLTVTITVDGVATAYVIEDVGVRMKGNTSRTNFYNANDGIYNAIHLKISFQETFDEDYYGSDAQVWSDASARKARKNRTFASLEKLDLRWNKCYDSTYLRESYAYDLYRANGVMAPLVNLCTLNWSGLHMGVYTLNEPVDELFLEKRLPEEALGGDLYKLGWTSHGATFTSADSIGIEDELAGKFYAYDLKTNKKTSTHEALKNLITGLNSGSVTKKRFAELVDVQNFLNYAAVSYFVGNPDDLRYNYNNTYLYFRADTGQALFIPYDCDRCFGITYEWNPSGDGMVSQDPFSTQSITGRQENPLFRYSVDAGGLYVAEFAQVLKTVAADPLLDPETFAARFAAAKALYGSEVTPGKTLHNSGGRSWSFALEQSENLSFRRYITAKMQYFNDYIKNVDLNAETVTHYIRGDFNDWSSQSAWAMKNEDGVLTFTLKFSKSFRFKVYAEASGRWYGVESLPEDSTLAYTTDSHGNFCLEAGSYLVRFDPDTEIVTVTAV